MHKETETKVKHRLIIANFVFPDPDIDVYRLELKSRIFKVYFKGRRPRRLKSHLSDFCIVTFAYELCGTFRSKVMSISKFKKSLKAIIVTLSRRF